MCYISNMKEKSKETLLQNEDSDALLRDLIVELRKQNSFFRGFWLSMVKGIGYTIGGTILVGFLLVLFNKSIHNLKDYLSTHINVEGTINLVKYNQDEVRK